jgi:hypothetical protein
MRGSCLSSEHQRALAGPVALTVLFLLIYRRCDDNLAAAEELCLQKTVHLSCW